MAGDLWTLDLRAATLGRGTVGLSLAAGSYGFIADRVVVYSSDPAGSGGVLQVHNARFVLFLACARNCPPVKRQVAAASRFLALLVAPSSAPSLPSPSPPYPPPAVGSRPACRAAWRCPST